MTYEIADTDIAIVGMAGRFPGARNIREYWELIRSGRTAILERSPEELAAAGVPAELLSDPDYVPFSGVIEDVAAFDAGFFGIGPRDAAIMDPQHRHFYECAWEALEDAGHPPARFPGAIGIYAGAGMNGYLLHNLLSNPEMADAMGMFLLRHTANDKDFLSTGVSYRLNLKGPSINVQTACSTSLVATHLAAQSLINRECDLALAGGVTIEVPHGQGYLYREGEILARDGVCRAFDEGSSGTVLTGGVAIVALRRLEDALEDGDHIYAVIKGSAINNDGADKVGYLAPSVEGHAAVVTEALAVAGIEARTVQYMEAHGTGTEVGDPIELAALTQAHRADNDLTGYCRLGSVKPSIGHLDTAAGAASLIKASLALEHAELPPLANFSAPNPDMDIEGSPFLLSSEPADWPTASTPRRAGVSSLGVGGTNAHVVLEAAPPTDSEDEEVRQRVLVLSGKTAEAADRARAGLADFLESNPSASLQRVAWTLQSGREEFGFRHSVAASDVPEAIDRLREAGSAVAAGQAPTIAFMFPGGGSQYPNMGRDLYNTEPVYRAAFDESLQLLSPELASAVRELVFPKEGFEEAAAEQLALPSVQLPAIFMTEYALAQLWLSWGVQPAAMTGHSLGEYTAACLAGVFSLNDALDIVALRGRLMERVPDAAMLSINLPEPEVAMLLAPELSLAAVNAPGLCVVSGAADSIALLERQLETKDVTSRRLKITGAVHCNLLDPFLEEFARGLSRVRFQEPRIPYISNLTGTWVRAQDATDPAYWVRHLRHTVRFADGLEALLEDSNRVLIEIGPGNTLTSLTRQQARKPVAVLASMPHAREAVSDAQHAYTTLGQAWRAGAEIDWRRQYGERTPQRVSLPTYPFAREHHWIEPGKSRNRLAETNIEARPLDEWFSAPAWTQTPEVIDSEMSLTGETWLVVCDDTGVGESVAAIAKGRGANVISATIGGPESAFLKLDARTYHVNPSALEDYEQLAEQLQIEGLVPGRVIHTGGIVNGVARPATRRADYQKNAERGFYSLVALLRAFGPLAAEQPITVTAVTRNGFAIDGDSDVIPEVAMMEGPLRVATHEYPGLHSQLIDVPASASKKSRISLPSLPRRVNSDTMFGELGTRIVNEAANATDGQIVALRTAKRWERTTTRVSLPPATQSRLQLKPSGCYLITGGSGAIGMNLARELATTRNARLVLLSRSAGGSTEAVAELEALGATVLCLQADVTDEGSLGRAAEAARARFGRIDGVFHAAGVLDDAPMAVKDRESLDRVLNVKTLGTLALESVFDPASLDFFVLFSSVSATLGAPGQVDYSAANAFLNAFAAHRTAKGDRHTTAVAWSMWRESEMAKPAAAPIDVAWPELPLSETSRGVFETVVSTERSWVLDEHRTEDGAAIMPGTGFIELFRQAASSSGRALSLEDITFLRPMPVDSPRTVQVRIASTTASVHSRAAAELRGEWIEHATCRLAEASPKPGKIDLEDGLRRTAARAFEHEPPQAVRQHGRLRFGPRWHNLCEVRFGEGEALARLRLGDDFRNDIEAIQLHPALLDMATGFGLPLLAGYEQSNALYVPLSYERIDMFAPLPAESWSHLRVRTGVTADDPTATFDVTIVDELGAVLVEVQGLTMRRLTEGLTLDTSSRSSERSRPAGRLVQLGRRHGITAPDGIEALMRVLASQVGPQITVSPLPLATLESAVETDSSAANREGPAVARPELKSTFSAPRDPIETRLAEFWSEALGVAGVGVDDDFFDLGGHSLIALRLFAKVKSEFGIDFGLATLFQTPTISGLAEIIRGDRISEYAVGETTDGSARKPWPCLVPIKPSGTKLPLFCVHGAKGNVLNFQKLGRMLPADQPFYGLQIQGLNGVDPFHTSMSEMAAHYVSEVREKQPHGPYLLGGFSGGGLVALEMAAQLQAVGEEVATVMLFDSPAPDYNRMRTFPWFQLRNVESILQYGPPYLWEKVKGRFYWWNWGKGRPSGLDFYHFGNAIAGYQPSVFNGNAHLFRVKTRIYPGDLGWSKWIRDGIETHDVSGSHEGMWREPHVKTLAKLVSDALASTHARLTGPQ